MKKYVLASAILTAISLISGCSKNTQTGNAPIFAPAHDRMERGIEVGNGRTIDLGNGKLLYPSNYGFQFEFGKELRLDVASPELIRVDNSPLLKKDTTDEQTSSITFKVLRAPDLDNAEITNLAALRAFAEKNNAGRSFSETTFPGAQGLFNEIRTESRLESVYYVLTSGGVVIRIDLNVFASAQGFALVAPIVDSLISDFTPPKVLEVKFSGPARAGEGFELLIHATDDISGLKSFCASVRSSDHPDSSISDGCSSNLTPVPGKPDWYSVKVESSNFIPSGEYYLETLSARDAADNYISLNIEHNINSGSSSTYFSFAGIKDFDTGIPVAKTQVTNDKTSDFTPPKVLEVKFSGPARAGEGFELLIHATDDISGLKSFCASVRSSDHPDSSISDGCSSNLTPVPGKPDWYSVKVESSNFIPSGEYYLETLSARDAADNYISLNIEHNINSGSSSTYFSFAGIKDFDTGIPVAKTQVTNDKTSDFTPPKVLEVKFSGPARAGEGFELLIHATDDISGLKSFCASVRSSDHPDSSISDGCSSNLTPVPGKPDWYSVKVESSNFIPSGEYYLETLSARDAADNYISLNIEHNINSGSSSTYFSFAGIKDFDTGIPVAKTQVTH